MPRTLLAGALLVLSALGRGPLAAEGDRFLARARQLTFEGRRAGEAYFSADGRRLVFQSEREPGNPFFQIYEMDLTTGDTRRVSPGQGKTTCAFFRPGAEEILFASTHHDPRSAELQQAELTQRAAGAARRYEWDFDPEMEIYVERGRNGPLVRLTNVRGYDAEASYSPDGRTIVFTSNREAYASDLSAEDQRLLATDASHFAEIYVVGADGSSPKRLTSTPGYDGGPFFTPAGRIVWRRFAPGGLVADVWSMNADGSDARQITDFGAMSWAPYPHPSGRYLVFTTNKLGMSNFELYLVDSEGRKEPVRVTYTDGFDGLPVPSPDGKRLTWTSNRRGGSGQVFLAEWDHEAALAALAAAPERKP